ncbi:MAG: TetR/AcrR family transcriptional regulator [Pseudomonadales bacterium]|nr:TetR/AcrR family transcriptional regulator [Pseudomonadales bacterium]
MSEPEKPYEVADPDYSPRERGLKRRDLILDAAMEVFLERGFEAASLSEIMARAGGSLATLYRLFGNKEGLFTAVIERRGQSIFGELEIPDADDDVRAFLEALGRRLLDLLLSADVIRLNRLILAEGVRNPRIREIFMEQAPNRMYRFLSGYLEQEIRAGKLASDLDARLAAIQFVEMIRGPFYLRGLLGEAVDQTPEAERDRIVREAVKRFLYGAAQQ